MNIRIKLLGLLLVTTVSVQANDLPNLPEPVSNNAVASVSTTQGDYFISFMGLDRSKDFHGVHNKVWALKVGDKQWQAKKPVPSSLTLKGRLASIAAAVNEHVYLFGGYTVAADHQEISSPDVYRYNVVQDNYEQLAPMPVPVDDSVALVYQNRYIYLVSGWHNAGNVNLVQMYDTQNNTWQQASPFLGAPVFGHSGAIAENTMVICDGVIVQPQQLKRRKYADVAQCLIGKINKDSPTNIDWQLIDHPSNDAKYRMAAAAYNDSVIFVGGSNNPYNYNGIGYNGVAAPASNEIWQYHLKTNLWQQLINTASDQPFPATMDHRGLIIYQQKLFTIGGMNSKQQVSDEVIGRNFK